ncbi:MAG: hypothetical protein GIW99_05620 [Candidatus Eremiobacteraeota bacterium]|nr:hypothetical protein [Candidatus Eremiobacteraeota bacterium]
MYYKEFLRMRNAVKWLAISLAVMLVAHAALHLFVAGMSSNSGGATNFVGIFGTAALVIGGIMATVFGSTLAYENDGHLEVAWTKPHSRTEYATTAMLVNAAGIMFCVLMSFFAFVLTWLTPGMHEQVTWNLSPSTANELLGFALFPLAWYAVIVALSARLRGGALVQSLIWPVALVLLALHQIPFTPVWHSLFAALNIVNPLSYVSLMGGRDVNTRSFAAVALALFALGGWAFATIQWRRLEA